MFSTVYKYTSNQIPKRTNDLFNIAKVQRRFIKYPPKISGVIIMFIRYPKLNI